MRAMVMEKVGPWASLGPRPLDLKDVAPRKPGPREVAVQVAACGVCRTELDQIEGRIEPPRLPIVPGHQAVGTIAEVGSEVRGLAVGDRAGVSWFFSSCGTCRYCISGRQNLCDAFEGAGCHADGGYSEFMIVPQAAVLRIPDDFTDLTEAAPLLCAGAIGYRSLRLA